MCRFLAYQGDPIFLADLVCKPTHSLVQQSRCAQEGKTPTNGDGFGLGWYGQQPKPELHHEAGPAWADEHLQTLSAQVRSRLFFAHVRASTGTATARANCHPFAHRGWLFMHNGQVGGYAQVRHAIAAMIPEELQRARKGTTDSEAVFLAAVANGLCANPVAAVARTLHAIKEIVIEAGIAEPLRFTAALTDGETLFAFRWASDDKPPRLYYRETPNGLVVASEPIDGCRQSWREVPKGCSLVSRRGRGVVVRALQEASERMAA